jgi:hypothetical protein
MEKDALYLVRLTGFVILAALQIFDISVLKYCREYFGNLKLNF